MDPQSIPLAIQNSPAAHRIPNEILDDIALYVSELYEDVVDRTPLLHMCLVSRRWAELGRPELWEYVVITSAAHLQRLCHLLDSLYPPSLPSISHYIQSPVCAVDFTDRGQIPWLHHVYPQLAPRIKHTIYELLNVIHDGTLINLRTIHPHLPRTVPSCFAPIRTLWLNRAEFKTRAAFLHLLLSLVHLRTLVCRDLSWKSDELPPPSLLLRSNLHIVWVDDGSHAWTEDREGMLVWWLLPAAFGRCSMPNPQAARAREAVYLLRDLDFKTIIWAIRALQSGRRLTRFRIKVFPAEDVSHVEIRCIFASHESSDSEVKVHLTFGFTKPIQGDATAARTVEINDLQITLSGDTAYRDGTWTLDDWTVFVRCTLRLPELSRMCVQFDFEDRMQAFVNTFGAAFKEADGLVRFRHVNDSGRS